MACELAKSAAVIFVLAAALPSALAASSDRLLAAISQVESGDRDDAVGRRGERSRYQLSERVWLHFSSLPFSRGDDPGFSRDVALAYLGWIEAQLRLHRRPATPYEMALAWNAGVAGSRRPSSRARDYAERVAALYDAESPGAAK